MTAPRPPDEPEPGLAESFFAVGRDLRGYTRTALEPWDLAPSQARALVTVGRHGPMRLGALAERLHIAARSATEVVDALEERGLAVRTADPDDRRATLVAPTEDGWSALTAFRRARTDRADAYFERLEPADREALHRILGRLLEPAADAPGSPPHGAGARSSPHARGRRSPGAARRG